MYRYIVIITNDIMVKWLKYSFRDDIISPKILLLDAFSAHWTDDVQSIAKELNVTVMKILLGLTSTCQSADISWNQPFKSYLRNKWTEKSLSQIEKVECNLKFQAPSRRNIIQWVCSSSSQLSGFTNPGYIKNTE